MNQLSSNNPKNKIGVDHSYSRQIAPANFYNYNKRMNKHEEKVETQTYNMSIEELEQMANMENTGKLFLPKIERTGDTINPDVYSPQQDNNLQDKSGHGSMMQES